MVIMYGGSVLARPSAGKQTVVDISLRYVPTPSPPPKDAAVNVTGVVPVVLGFSACEHTLSARPFRVRGWRTPFMCHPVFSLFLLGALIIVGSSRRVGSLRVAGKCHHH